MTPASPVKIASTESVGTLKKAIKEEKSLQQITSLQTPQTLECFHRTSEDPNSPKAQVFEPPTQSITTPCTRNVAIDLIDDVASRTFGTQAVIIEILLMF
jgi:hypothetical protein